MWTGGAVPFRYRTDPKMLVWTRYITTITMSFFNSLHIKCLKNKTRYENHRYKFKHHKSDFLISYTCMYTFFLIKRHARLWRPPPFLTLFNVLRQSHYFLSNSTTYHDRILRLGVMVTNTTAFPVFINIIQSHILSTMISKAVSIPINICILSFYCKK